MPVPQPAAEPGEIRSLGKKPLPEFLPARMLNEFVYCPRLFYYEWVEGVFRGNSDTAEGSARHARVDTEPGHLPPAEELEKEGLKASSVELSSEARGLIAKMDILETVAGPQGRETPSVRPVDYKRGRPALADDMPAAWPADRVQVAAQALILRDNGYRCDEAVLYYGATKQRVRVPLTGELEREVMAAAAQARATAAGPIPPPLEGSPKCPRCSLVGICLPDETAALHDHAATVASSDRARQMSLFAELDRQVKVRPLVSARDDLRPLYLNSQGMRVGKSGEVIQIREKDTLVQEARLGEVSQINVFGNVQISTQAVQSFCHADIPVVYFSQGGWFYGITRGLGGKNVMLRQDQFQAAANPAMALEIARRLVAGKIQNQRTLLRRNHEEPPAEVVRQLKRLSESALLAPTQESLLGIEGTAARLYFEHFPGMLKPDADDSAGSGSRAPAALNFDFQGRNRRPPRDPVNALLSLAYSLLVKDLTITCQAVGFDPFWGFFHQPRFGRPGLALDLMEPFRPLIADSAVLSAINTRMVTASDFVRSGPAVALTPNGRKGFLRAYELRMDALVTHPLLDYRVSYRRMLEIQARLLARYIGSEIPEYPVFETR